jgi:hypothetical protein
MSSTSSRIQLKLSLRTVFYLAVFIKEILFYLPFPSLNFHETISSVMHFFLYFEKFKSAQRQPCGSNVVTFSFSR